MIRRVLLAAACLIAGGCAAHRIQYYQISVSPAPPALVPTGPSLLVGHIATPKALQDSRIRYHVGANEVGAYEYHRWTDEPGTMVKEALIHELRASDRYSAVQETGASAHGDYSLRGRLVEFAELDDHGIQTRVSLDLELRETATGRLVWNQMLTHDDPVESKKVSAVVQSLDRNLRTVLNEASGAIGAYVVAHPIATR